MMEGGYGPGVSRQLVYLVLIGLCPHILAEVFLSEHGGLLSRRMWLGTMTLGP